MTASSGGSVAEIKWPAILVYAGEHELGVVSDQGEWDLDPDLHAWPYAAGDRLIDSAGTAYRLAFAGSGAKGSNLIEPTDERHTAADVQRLAERHLEAIGAQPDWLSAHLADIPTANRIHATILYVARHERQSVVSAEDGGDE